MQRENSLIGPLNASNAIQLLGSDSGPVTQYNLNGVPAYKVIPNGSVDVKIIFKKNKIIYSFGYPTNLSTIDEENINQLISSFKFNP